MDYLNIPVLRKPFPSWNGEDVVFAPVQLPALSKNET